MSLILSGTNGLSDVDGSAATPAIRGTDTNTGIFFPAADTIAFAEGGTEAMRLDSSGNLGIGTSSPSVKLDVNGSAKFGGSYVSFGNNGYIRTDATNVLRFQPGSGGYEFAAQGNGSVLMSLNTDGNLGLGVTPSAWGTYKAMEVGGAALSLMGGTSGAIFGSVGVNWYFDGTNRVYKNTAAATYYNQANGQHQWHYAASGTAGATATFTQAMTLDASGRLGIGVTGPTQKLQISDGTYSNFYVAPGYGSGAGTLIGVGGGEYLAFATNGLASERARIDSSGNLLVNKTTTSQSTAGTILYGGGSSNAAYFTGAGAQAIYVNRETSDGTVIDIRRAASTVGTISVTASATAYNTSSDYRLKEDIQPMTGALARVAALKPVTYKWKADGSDGEGFIAHELQEVVPECVTGVKDGVDAEGNPKYQGIDTSFLVATLTAAIQELKAEFDAYKLTHP